MSSGISCDLEPLLKQRLLGVELEEQPRPEDLRASEVPLLSAFFEDNGTSRETDLQ